MNIRTVLYPTGDLTQAKAVFTALAGAPTTDSPYYVGWTVDGQEIGLDPNGHKKGMTGATPYWHVEDIEASMQALVDAGATVTAAPKDVGGGRLIATVAFDGGVLGLLQP